jgi:hypothetical protein
MRARGMTGRQLLPRIEELAAVFRAGLAVLDELRSAVTGEPRQPTLTRRPFPSLPPYPLSHPFPAIPKTRHMHFRSDPDPDPSPTVSVSLEM